VAEPAAADPAPSIGAPALPAAVATGTGAIVVMEDVNEAVYRVDRMLRQLLMAGMLDGCRALVFGHCTECPEEADDGARPLDDVLAETADALGVPCLAGVPVGRPGQTNLLKVEVV